MFALPDTKHTQATAWLLGLVTVATASVVTGEELRIGIIDFYGLSRLAGADLRQALTFKEGDAITVGQRPAFLADSERRLLMVPGVSRAQTNLVCCDDGRVIVYVGIQEDGAPAMRFRVAPGGTARLPGEIVQASDDFAKAGAGALQHGNFAEDHSEGHALSHDPALRAVQERFIGYARRDLATLREVLRDSSHSSQRALAALVLGYVTDKQAVVDDLVHAMSDPVEAVRNNAMRALWVFAQQASTAGRPAPKVPYEPFIALLNSPVWTDRNKASLALAALSGHRDAALLQQLQREAVAPLAEMARWTSAGHALAAFIILGRIAGYSDEAAQGAWDGGEREAVISAALKRPRD
jgi:hypothetical protein